MAVDSYPWRRWQLWAVIFVIFTALGLLGSAQLYVGMALLGASDLSWSGVLAGTVPFWYAKALLLPAVVWAGKRLPLTRAHWLRSVLPHIPLSFLYAAAQIAIGSAIALMLSSTLQERGFSAVAVSIMGRYFAVGVMFYWAFLATWNAFEFYRLFQERARAAAELQEQLTRAQLDALRMQLNPHFLFNTLNSITMLALQQRVDGAVRMLARLSEVLRMTLDRSDHTVSLSAELDFLAKYLEIEQVRFADRLELAYEIDEEALGAEVPNLLLQPLVENALKHGLGGMRGEVRIEIGARVVGDMLHLWVADTGYGFPVVLREGIGLSNTRARLEQLYGSEHRLEISPSGQGARVSISIPHKRHERPVSEAAYSRIA